MTGQRTYIFRQADPDGGPAIAQNGNTTLRVEPYGSRRLSAQNILNLRGSKDLKLGGARRLNIDVDVFNVLNAATPTAATFVTGPVIRLHQQRHPGSHRTPGRALRVLAAPRPCEGSDVWS